MLWRANICRTLQTSVSLKKETNCEKFRTQKQSNKRNLHYQSNQINNSDLINGFNFVNRRCASSQSAGSNNISSTIAKFYSENICKLTGLPTVEELTKTLTVEHCMPIELLQNGFIYLHCSCGLPWWSCLAISALTARLMLFPLVIFAERNTARISNNLPQIQFLQMQLAEANRLRDNVKATRLAQEISLFKNHKKIRTNLLNVSLVTLAQAPLFIMFLTALRGLPKAHLLSMQNGGILWFANLTAADPTYLLPIATSASLCLIVELTLRKSKFVTDNKVAFYIFRAQPLIILPFTVDFSAAFLFFWTCFNLITLAQTSIFQIAVVRSFFKIQKTFSFTPNALVIHKPTFMKKEKSPHLNKKFMQEFEVKQRINRMRFSKARKDSICRPPPAPTVENLSPSSQRFKLRAIMESTKTKY